ncbi:V-type proton ATPase 116 kDa subunit a 1-like [Paramacrobiotus metropolitanus]|uniref:V-type proton ATPase 116 kDa subunit a 1-like n=1 Tax=Paramacrobiotus metropolitanus TaxID=2943436 RepID=UPI0024461135|nr:V-type proton ATPase 116 kDa subunit a 1-like [Paramacrobiotus metropolitanus]
MGTLFRSQRMVLCQFYLQSEAAYCCVAELGELGVCQFRDLNADVNAFQRKFVNEIRRCDEMERILRFLTKECEREEIPILRVGENPATPLPRELVDLEGTMDKLEHELKEVNGNYEALSKNMMELVELKHVLRRAQTIFDQDDLGVHAMGGQFDAPIPGAKREAQISFLAGTILQQKVPAFERLIWRLSRGTVLVRCHDIETPLEDPLTGAEIRKSTFFAFYQGEQLKVRVKKICEAFKATIFPCPETSAEMREMAIQVMTRIEDLKTLIGHTQQHRLMVMTASAKNIDLWCKKLQKIKAVYTLMNNFNIDITQRCFVGEGWCPLKELDRIRYALGVGTEKAECNVPSIVSPIPTKDTPPTYHKTNKFTSGFQGIVDAYGMANYREVNPAPFTVITFPFLFAVMFGDAGHGAIMAALAAVLIWKEKWIESRRGLGEIALTMFGGRYIIFLMGLFSIYTGFIYNDIFSKSMNIFGSRWSAMNYNMSDYPEGQEPAIQLNPNSSDYINDNGPYPFGIDPVWAMASNKINFINSYKMKMSVILGVMQMMFGICLSAFNHTYFKKPLNIICEFIPQVIFLLCMFGYLVAQIFTKWIIFDASVSSCSPQLLIGLINMFLMKYSQENPNNGTCKLYTFYPHQKEVQITLVVVAVLCIPWMLFIKPIYNRVRSSRAQYTNVDDDNSTTNTGGHDDHASGESFSDIMIYQAIHTIEFCLGVISNTASYLRLWALSLAHSQLSEVLWTMVYVNSFMFNNFAGLFLVFAVFSAWASATLGILVFMEGMSAFLHALRLHWVEFQNKFYGGSGYAFEPFDFKKIDAMNAIAERSE